MGCDVIRAYLPGIALLTGLAITAVAISRITPLNRLLLAVAVGMILTNTLGVPDVARPGVSVNKLCLETGIVLMGARLALGRIFDAGTTVFALVVGTLVFTVLFVELLSRRTFDLSERLGSLLATGSGICGVSAIAAVAGAIDADEAKIAYAAGTILLFDAVTLVVYPVVGGYLDLPSQVYGVWAGLTMFSTGPVVAAGFAYSTMAGKWATLTKLTRNVFIGVAAVGYSVYYTRSKGSHTDASVRNTITQFWTHFPKFIIGFLVVVIVVNLGSVTDSEIASLKTIYEMLFLLAFAGLGLSIQIKEIRKAGLRPILVVLFNLVVVSTLALAAVYILLQ